MQSHKRANSSNPKLLQKKLNSFSSNKKCAKKKRISESQSKISSIKNILPFKLLEKIVYTRFNLENSNDKNFYNIKVINEIICNETTHVVAMFKDYLIYGDYSEFLQELYKVNESKDTLKKLFEYYESCSVIFPNYIVLPESKYIYKNIQRKQRVIDNQQELEQIEEDKKNGKVQISSDDSNLFNTRTIDSILNMTNTSLVKGILGINNTEKNEKLEDSLDNIIKTICKAEEDQEKISKKNIGLFINKKPNSGYGYKAIESRNLRQKINNEIRLQMNNTQKHHSLAKSNINLDRKPYQIETSSFINKVQNTESVIISGNNKPKNKSHEKGHSKTRNGVSSTTQIKKNILDMLLFNNTDSVLKSFREFNSKIKNGNSNSKSKNSRNIKPKGILSTLSISKGDYSLKNSSKNSSGFKNMVNNKFLLASSNSARPQQIDSYAFKMKKPLTSRENKKNSNDEERPIQNIKKQKALMSISNKKTFTNSSSNRTATGSYNNANNNNANNANNNNVNNANNHIEEKIISVNSRNKHNSQNSHNSNTNNHCSSKKNNYVSVIQKGPPHKFIYSLKQFCKNKTGYISRNANNNLIISSQTQRLTKKETEKIIIDRKTAQSPPNKPQTARLYHFPSKSIVEEKVPISKLIQGNYNQNLNQKKRATMGSNISNQEISHNQSKVKGIKIKGFDKIFQNNNKKNWPKSNSEREVNKQINVMKKH